LGIPAGRAEAVLLEPAPEALPAPELPDEVEPTVPDDDPLPEDAECEDRIVRIS
jgi:hypothetical protein